MPRHVTMSKSNPIVVVAGDLKLMFPTYVNRNVWLHFAVIYRTFSSPFCAAFVSLTFK